MDHKKMNFKQLQKIAAKVAKGKASAAEQKFLDEYYNLFDARNDKHEASHTVNDEVKQQIQQRLADTLNSGRPEATVRSMFSWYNLAAGVLLFAIAGAGIYTIYHKPVADKVVAVARPKPVVAPIVPGGNNAMLTLANGTRITLNDKNTGTLAREMGVKITKTADGQLVYQSIPHGAKAAADQFNIMETPRGGIYQVYLPDGTHVWLNSETRLKYPVAFTGTERKVELTGEAYFEVAHNAAKPFRVVSNNQLIEVLGTHFNVNAYPDEQSSKTTLLQGSVKVIATASGASKTIVPGQQAVLRQTGIQLHMVDTDNALAWKTGLFRFDNEPVRTVMKKIARWYDVEIVYKDDVDDLRFGGTVSRFTDIQKVLSKLELTSTINFKIDGRRIIVMR